MLICHNNCDFDFDMGKMSHQWNRSEEENCAFYVDNDQVNSDCFETYFDVTIYSLMPTLISLLLITLKVVHADDATENTVTVVITLDWIVNT